MCEKNKKPQETIEITDDQLEQASGGESVGDICTLPCRECAKFTDHKCVQVGYWRCTVCGRWFDNKGFVP